MNEKMKAAERDLSRYTDEVPVDKAVKVIRKVTGVNVHLMSATEVEKALAHARTELRSGRVRDTPWNVNKEIQDASPERWEDLSQEARSTVGGLWAPEGGAELVITSLDPVQPKEKILSMIENLLAQKERLRLGKSGR